MLARPVWDILHTDLGRVHLRWRVVQTEPAHMQTGFTETLVVGTTSVSLFRIVYQMKPENVEIKLAYSRQFYLYIFRFVRYTFKSA